ncbi:MAG: hypothetical protein ACI33I_02345 [Clostridium sp.]
MDYLSYDLIEKQKGFEPAFQLESSNDFDELFNMVIYKGKTSVNEE